MAKKKSKARVSKPSAAPPWEGARVARAAAILSVVIAVSYVIVQQFEQSGRVDPKTVVIAALIAFPGVLLVLGNASGEPRQRVPLLAGASGMLMSLAIISIATIGFALLVAGFLAIVSTVRAMQDAGRSGAGLAVVAGLAGAVIPFAIVLVG